MTKAPHIILAAGGTGGHMMPAEAVAEVLTERGYKVSLITDKRGDDLPNAMNDIEKTVLGATSHMTGGLLGKIKFAFKLMLSTRVVRKQFAGDRPTVVVGFGGYPSMPAVMAAKNMGIPYILHEQNAVLGKVNRMMAKAASKVALTFEETSHIPAGAHTVVTGNPVRKLISKLANIAYAVPLGFGDIRVFVIGGSQGARILSDVVPPAIKDLPDHMKQQLIVTHQARPEDVERVVKAYEEAGVRAEVQPYFDDVGSVLLRTQLVVSRSGASTLAELMAMGRPAVLVPLAIAADNHQLANAKIVADAGGAWVIEEDGFTPASLQERLEYLFENTGSLRDYSDGMRSLARLDAAEMVADLAIEICDGETPS